MGRLLLLVPLLLWAFSAPDVISARFCEEVVSRLYDCPTPATVDSVQLDKYQGKWYLAAADARSMFAHSLGQRGAQCATASYSDLSTRSNRSSLTVWHKALHFASLGREVTVRAMSDYVATAGRDVRMLCQLLVGQKIAFQQSVTVAGLLATLKKRVDIRARLLAPSGLQGVPLRNITSQMVAIEQAIASSSGVLESVYRMLERIQRANHALFGATLPAPSSASSSVRDIQQQATLIKQAASGLQRHRRQMLTSANIIQEIAGTQHPSVRLSAARLVSHLELKGRLNRQQESLAGLGDSLLTLSGQVKEERRTSNVLDVSGRLQRSSSQGPLSFTSPRAAYPYRIIKLEGVAAQGYDLSLVFTCTTGFASSYTPLNGFFLFSRKPRVDKATMDRALAFVKQSGLFFGGDYPILPVNQDSGLCRPLQ